MSFNFKRGIKRIGRYLSSHQPAILAGVGCAGVVITAVVAVKCHIKAEDILSDAYDDLSVVYTDYDDHLISAEECDKKEFDIRLTCAKSLIITYSPAVLSGALTIASIIFSHKAHLRHEAVLTTALNGATALLSDYKEEAKKLLKPKQKEELEENVTKKQMKRHPVPSEEMIYDTGLGHQLMRIKKTNLFIRISEDNLNKILYNKIQMPAINDGYRTYNDLEWELCRFQSGDGAAWCWEDRQFINGDILKANVTYSNYTNLRTGENESIGLVDFSVEPVLLHEKPSTRYY